MPFPGIERGDECSVPASGFAPDRLRLIERVEHEHFWFVCRRRLVDRVLERYLEAPVETLVDVGCGTGYNLRCWRRHAGRVIGVDRSISRSSAHRPASRASRSIAVVEGDAERLPFGDGVADAVVALDVLEHVDDRRALTEVVRILRPGGRLVATVPAMPWLWSFRDEAAGHRRRYDRRMVQERIGEAGLTMLFLTYYQFLVFPAVVLSRWLGRRGAGLRDLEDRPQPLLNPLLKRVNGVEVALFRAGLRLPWGSSLVLTAEKT